jgi:hypothetical protein
MLDLIFFVRARIRPWPSAAVIFYSHRLSRGNKCRLGRCMCTVRLIRGEAAKTRKTSRRNYRNQTSRELRSLAPNYDPLGPRK